jgi:tetratricopeptide (TPR) repeat protein
MLKINDTVKNKGFKKIKNILPVFTIFLLIMFSFIGDTMSKNLSPHIIFSIPQGWEMRVISPESVTAYNPDIEGDFIAGSMRFDINPLFRGEEAFLKGMDEGLDAGMPVQVSNYQNQGSKIYSRGKQKILLRHFNYQMNEHNYRAIQWIFVISNAYVINFVSSGSFEKDNSEDLKRLGDAMDTLTFINHRKDFLSGLKEYFEKNYDAALSLFEKCIKMEDSVPEYYNYKALCLQKTKGISEINTIEKIFLKALTLDNQNVTALTNLAGCSLFSNKPKNESTRPDW